MNSLKNQDILLDSCCTKSLTPATQLICKGQNPEKNAETKGGGICKFTASWLSIVGLQSDDNLP